jgi:hypothetical protein
MLVGCEQDVEPTSLAVGEQVGAGVQGPPGPVERVTRQTAVAVEILPDPTTAAVERVTGQTDDVEGVHHRDRVGDLLCCSGLEPGEPVHRD